MPNIEPSDSVGNVGCGSLTSRTSSQLARKQISLRLKRQKAELQQKQRQIKFEQEFQQKQQLIEFELRQAELDAEEQMLNLSNPNSVVSALSQNQQQVYKPFPHAQPRESLVTLHLNTQKILLILKHMLNHTDHQWKVLLAQSLLHCGTTEGTLHNTTLIRRKGFNISKSRNSRKPSQ